MLTRLEIILAILKSSYPDFDFANKKHGKIFIWHMMNCSAEEFIDWSKLPLKSLDHNRFYVC